MKEEEIAEFWESNPCGGAAVGGLKEDYENFFQKYDTYRYSLEGHILRCLDNIDFKQKKTLEIGLGQGADGEQIIRRGGVWSGLDITNQSVKRVEKRLSLRNLSYNDIQQGSVLEIPHPDNSFDIVFSHGVLHHIPEIIRAQKEIARVLSPEGELIVMLYAKYSLNYLLSISILRRVGLIALYYLRINPGGIYNSHLKSAREAGLWNYLRMENFIHRSTDGPQNPYSKVYDKALVEKDFPLFEIKKMYKVFMHAPPLPVHALPGGKYWGWHIWVHLIQK